MDENQYLIDMDEISLDEDQSSSESPFESDSLMQRIKQKLSQGYHNIMIRLNKSFFCC